MKKDYSNIDVDYNNLKNEDLKLLRKGANLIITYNGEKIRLKKVIQSHQNNNMMTMTELKKNKLQPDAPPIAWCFQQWSGEIFYYYDKNKVKPLQITDKERQKRKEYIKDLKRRKTCPICKKVQNKLENLNFHTLYNPFSKNKMQRIYSCNDCYDKKEYEILLMKRNEKHDFTTCFTEQGINLNEDISKEDETDEWEKGFAEADKKYKEQMNKFYNNCKARNLCEEEIMYEEMMLPENKQNLYIFIDLNRTNEYTQSGYFTYMGNPEKAKKAYYKLSNYFHPDKLTGDTEKFKNISLAWQMYKTVILKTK